MNNIYNKKLDTTTTINCRCAEPVIIINPSVKRNIDIIDYIHIPGEHFKINYNLRNYSKLLPRIYLYKKNCDYRNINDYYSITYDGEIIPLFILVPCNKCFICRDKLSQMWQFRGIAETNSSQYGTYFITLTYNNEFLPHDGVSVTAIQLFMKRLRNNLDKLCYEHHLKYFACGEYGSNTKRPHYHLILWHFPDDKFVNVTDVLNFIEKSWSVYDYENEEHIQIGFAYCKKCDSGSLSYVMKYTRKMATAPVGKNPYFTCCSKHIGLSWFYDNYDFLKENPHILSVSIKDPLRSNVYTSPFPTYYKNKLMPNLSSIFPKEVIESFEYCLSLHVKLSTINNIYPHLGYKVSPILNKYYALLVDIRESDSLNSFDIDDCYYYRYSVGCPYSIDKIYQETQVTLQPYLFLLEQYYNKHIDVYLLSNSLKIKRKQTLDSIPQKDYTLDMLRVQNEKLENYRKKEIDREFF